MPQPLYEARRPTTLDEVVGQDKIIQRLRVLQDRGGLGGRAIWISGRSGTGKSTIARCIANEIADPYAVMEIDAQDLSMDRLREFEQMCRFKPIGKGWHVLICNEAHGLSGKVVSKLQTVLEEPHVQRTATVVFTTTDAGQKHLFDTKMDALPFLSRCIQFKTDDINEVECAVHIRDIAREEGLDGQPIEAYIALVKGANCNLRQCLNEVESGAML